MIIVTGGAGFIGSNLVMALNSRGYRDILVVDNLQKGVKFKNLVDSQISDYLDKQRFIDCVSNGKLNHLTIEAVFHQGACSSTTEWDGRYMMENNYEYSKTLFNYCVDRGIPFIYASSAAVYGCGKVFKEDSAHESPLNIYGYSKLRFDQYVRERLNKIESQVVGLRYFNVYGPREAHKEGMASVAYHLNMQLLESETVRLFEGCDGFADGAQLRDFVYVSDVVDINLWCYDHTTVSGIFNVGTGHSQPFNDVGRSVLDYHKRGQISYIAFPDHLKGCYQSFTEANLDALRGVGCQHSFKNVQQGVNQYLTWLNG